MRNKRFISIFITITMIISFIPDINQKAKAETLVIEPQISTKGQQTIALKNDGTVWGWGCNLSGELGDGTNISKNIPVKVKNLNGVASITTGFDHSAALKLDGTVWTWGSNSHGELGDGDGIVKSKNLPAIVKELSGVKAIAAGMYHTAALKEDGTVWTWGWNYYGELGDGTNTDKNIPVKVQNLSGVKAIAAGYDYTVALKEDGTIWAWGSNYYGELGDGTTTCRNIPVQVKGMSGVLFISAGSSHTAAVKEDGTVWTWGDNWYGELGNGTNGAGVYESMPVLVKGLSGVKSVTAGADHTAALIGDGSVWVWGRNDCGQLGDGTNIYKNIPEKLEGIDGVVSIEGGWMHTAALKEDGAVLGWGYNNYGELGDGTNTDKYIPVQALINLKNPAIKSVSNVCKVLQGIMVFDAASNQPVTDALVELGDASATTDSNGYAELNVPSGQYNLKISKTGYCDYLIDRFNFDTDKSYIFHIKINEGPTRPYISSIILNDSSSSEDIDLQYEKRNYRIEKDSSGNLINPEKCSIRIKVSGYSASNPAEYMFLQDGKVVLSENTGEFNDIIPAAIFDEDIPIWVVVKYADGASTKVIRTNMGVYMSTPKQNFKVSLGTKIGVAIPDNIPIVGGCQLNYGFDAIEASAEFDKDTFKIAFGVKDITNVLENWKDYKSMINNPLSEFTDLKNPEGIIGTKFSFFDNIKGDCDALGYIEGKIVDGKLVTTEGKVHFKIGAKLNWENQITTVPAPFVVTVEIGANVQLDSGIKFDFTNKSIIPDTEITFTLPHLEISGGIGFVKFGSFSAYGEGNIETLYNFTDKYYKTTIKVSAGIKIKVLAFENKKELGNVTWVHDGYNTQGAQINSAQELAHSDIFDKSQYTVSGRDYIKKPSVWIGGLSKYNILKSDYINQLNILQTNIYPYAEPKMAVIGDKQVMVWLTDNASRTSLNRTMLVYLVYDKTTGSWSAPQAVADDQTADFYPSIASDGSNLYVAWQNSREIFGDNGTIDDMEAAGEVETAKFNSETNTFDTPEVLTDNNILDTQPQLAVDNGKAAVVWTENSSNDIFGTSGLNTIFCSELNGTIWSSPSVLTDNQKSITGLSTSYMDGILTTAFAADADDDLSTLQDRDIYITKPGQSVQRLTDNQVLDSNPTFGMFNGQKTLYWYSDGNIKYLSDFTAAPSTVFNSSAVGLADNFKIVNNSSGKTAVIWTKDENEDADIYSSIYDPEKQVWSDDIKISNVGAYVRCPDGIFDDSGNFIIAFNRVTKTDTTEQSDLCTVKVVPSYNLSVNNVMYDDTKVVPGGSLPVEIDLTNKGELSADYFNVQVLDGTNVISSTYIEQEIKPGESETLNTAFTLPASISKKNYTIKITPVNGTDNDLSDNSKDITVGYTDLGIKVNQYYTGDKQMAAVKVYNSSYIPSGAVIKVRENTPDGNVLATKSIDTLAHGESALDIFEIDPEYLNYTDDVKALYFTVEPDQEELRTGDNNDYITVDKPVNSDVTANLVENDKSGSSYDITANFKNNTLDSRAAEAVFALYGDNERLLDMKIVDLNLDPDGETTLEQILNTTENVTDTKVFVLNDLKNINPLSNSSTVDMSQCITKPGITIGGKQGVSGEYGNALLSDDNGAVNGNDTIKLTLNQGQNPQLLTYLVLPFRADAAESSDGYSTAQEVQDSAAAFGIFNTSGVSDKSINLKSNLKSGEYIIKVGGGNGISSAADNDVIRYVYTYKSFDTNNDGIIDLKDIASAASLYNSKPEDNLYNKYLDLNSDNIIDIYDLVMISRRLNQ